ncbi:MAG TPA: transcription termination factor NusA [Polyangiaceae bacterium]|jgi:N utilization substance protein A|nr:transcription termination factor NusA [Polyangiaceae bacterium]
MAKAAASEGFEANLGVIIDQVAQEKGIERRILVETMEAAILKAAQAAFGQGRELEARFNSESGQIDLFQYMTVVEEVADPEREIQLSVAQKVGLEAELGEELGFQVFWHPRDAEKARQQDKDFGAVLDMKQARSTFGRIAAQTAKQVLLQRVRDAERDLIYEEFKDKKGQLIRGMVRRFEKGHNLIVDLGRTEGILPYREQTPRETYRPGDRIVAYVKDIDREARGPLVLLSRSDPHLVEKLFEVEVPEIEQGIVRIMGVAREPGSRSKIAVGTRDSDVDPVGACVGIKGSRVQAVVQELRGEKIDIVPYDPDVARYIIAAIQPADVNKVIVDEADNRMELVVPDEKLSLAIGRKGQNVRLASQLTGWKLDIISESKFKAIEEEALAAFTQIEGVSADIARALYRLGFRALEEVAEAGADELASVDGVGDLAAAQGLKERALVTMERLRGERIHEASTRVEPPTDREILRMVRGVGLRTLQFLEEGGYRSVHDIAREDPDRLSIKTGLSNKKARLVQEYAQLFLSKEWPQIEAARARIVPPAPAAASAAGEAAH